MKIYVASSWRNAYQPGVVAGLRSQGYEVYDFRNPRPGDNGFHWSEIDPEWQHWTPGAYRRALSHPIAEAGYQSDFDALDGCDVCVLVLPCGRSAHAEHFWAIGRGKPGCIYIPEPVEPELMYKLGGRICLDMGDVVAFLGSVVVEDRRPTIAEYDRARYRARFQADHTAAETVVESDVLRRANQFGIRPDRPDGRQA